MSEYPDFQKNPFTNGHANGEAGNGHDPNPFRLPFSEHPLEDLGIVDFASLPDIPSPQPWLVEGWLPMLRTSGFGGIGSEGKTTIAQQLATAAVRGDFWLGLPVKQMKAAMVLCEDEVEDFHRRQQSINRHYEISNNDLMDKLRIYARHARKYNYLAMFDRDGRMHLTPFFDQLLKDLKDFEAKLVVLDTKSDVFFGNQNDENQARTFVQQVCDQIARELGGLVLLIYHPSRGGVRIGDMMSGSIQWDAAFRSRMILHRPPPPKNDQEPEPDPDIRLLDLVKGNFTGAQDSLEVRWKEGVFGRDNAPQPDKPVYEKMAERSAAERIWHEHFAVLTERLRRVLSPDETAKNYAVKSIAKENRLSKYTVRCSERDLYNVMHALIKQGEYRVEEYGPPSRRQTRIVKVVQDASP